MSVTEINEDTVVLEKEAVREAADVITDITLSSIAGRMGMGRAILAHAANLNATRNRLGPDRLRELAAILSADADRLKVAAKKLREVAKIAEPFRSQGRPRGGK